MRGFNLNANRLKANQFVKNHGAHVRYLNISSCKRRPCHSNEMFQRSIKDLLPPQSQLRRSRLFEFKIKYLQLDRYRMPAPLRGRFVNYFVGFFKQQSYFKVFNMTSVQFSLSDGIRVLDSVGSKCGSVMEKLLIEDFFASRTTLFQIHVEKVKQILTHFSNLNYLAINYSCLSDNVLKILATNLEGLLKTFKIKVSKNDTNIHRISGQTWKQMVTCCPAFSVNFWFDRVGHSSDIMPMLKREIPVTDLHPWTGHDGDVDWGLAGTIDHIVECYRNSLESVRLEFDINLDEAEDVDEAILGLVSSCKKLKEVRISGVISLDTIESILQLQGEDKVHLQSLNILVWGLTYEEWEETLQITEKYANLVNERCLNFKITTDSVYHVN